MEESPILLTLIILFGFPIFFTMMWSFVLLLNSFLGGWQSVAQQYHHPYPFNGTLYRFQSVNMRIGQYTRVVNIGFNESGIYFVPIMIFRPFHKPLLIPWHDVEIEEANYIFVKVKRLKFRGAPNAKFGLHKPMFPHLEQYMQQ